MIPTSPVTSVFLNNVFFTMEEVLAVLILCQDTSPIICQFIAIFLYFIRISCLSIYK